MVRVVMVMIISIRIIVISIVGNIVRIETGVIVVVVVATKV